VLCVHGSGSVHRPIVEDAEAVAPSRTPGVARATAAPGVDLCLGGESVVHVPWGIAPIERQYRADNVPRSIVMDREGRWNR